MANTIIPSPLGFASIRYVEQNFSDYASPLGALGYGGLFYSYDGPVSDIIALASKDVMKNLYGAPDDTNAVEWWNIARALSYKSGPIGATAKIVRVVGDGSVNGSLAVSTTALIASGSTTQQRIDNEDDALNATIVFDGDSKIKFFSKYPTNIVRKIALSNADDFSSANIITGVTFSNTFDEVPGTNELAVVILNSDNEILEKFIVSLDTTSVDGYGVSNYIETLNSKSQYILAYDNTSVSGIPASFEGTSLIGGTVVAPLTADYITSLALYEDIDSVDVNYFVGNNKIISEMITLCENRLDCQLIWSANLSDVVGVGNITATSNLVTYSSTTLNRNTTYAEFFGNAGLIYDEYSKKSRWIELAGDLVGLRILKNLTGAEWEASAGLINGQIRDIIKLAFNPTPSQGITLGRNKINPVISKYGKGIVSWGISNYTSKKSALTDSTTRGLMIHIWRASLQFLEYKLFSQNDEITRNDIKAKMDQFLEGVKNSRGCYEYLVVVDETNNTPQIIDAGQLIVEVRIKPTRISQEILLISKIASTGANLEEL